MSRTAIEKRPLFHGNAVALSAHIRRPKDFFVPAVASSCLPVTGGLAKADSPAQNFHDIISFDSASTHVLGDFVDLEKAAEFTRGNHGENDLPTRTIAECRVRGLKIQVPGGRSFIADQLEVQAESSAQRQRLTEFITLRTVIEGVSVDGYALEITTDTEMFTQCPTKEKLCRTYEQSRAFRKRYRNRFYATGESSDSGCLGGLFGAKNHIPEARGIIIATTVATIKWDQKAAPETEIRGNQ
ncbi:MAG: hypothetical protein JO097_10160, partial [Acidobacteriaceae bacterium]|nr:hypothetical protein [Acidobacteriaceae bacterium]